MKLMKKKNKGFTLIEILLVVGFIALAGIGIYTVYDKVQISNQATQESRNLDTLRAGIKSLYGSRPNYNGLTNVVANNARITPDNMRTSLNAGDDKITNSFGGDVTIGFSDLGNGTSNVLSITYTGVPSAVCSKLATSAAVQFNQLDIANSPAIKEFGSNEPLDVAAAVVACNSGDTVDMVFYSL